MKNELTCVEEGLTLPPVLHVNHQVQHAKYKHQVQIPLFQYSVHLSLSNWRTSNVRALAGQG